MKTFKELLKIESQELEAKIASYAKELEAQGYTAKGAKRQAEDKIYSEFHKGIRENGREISEDLAVEAFQWAIDKCTESSMEVEETFIINDNKVSIFTSDFKRASFSMNDEFFWEGDFNEFSKNAGQKAFNILVAEGLLFDASFCEF